MNDHIPCGEPHPSLDERTDRRGEALTAVVCVGKNEHRGKHRARHLRGIILRWDAEAAR